MLLSSIVKAYNNVRVLCIGDVMLDHFIYGKVERISPEAPVPVFNYCDKKTMLGGVGNVVANLHTLGCNTSIICFIGEDNAGLQIRRKLDIVCENALCIEVKGFPTIEKTRIIAGNNHLLRIDNERYFDDIAKLNIVLESELNTYIRQADIVLLSDYAKGMLSPKRCQHIIKVCIEAKKPVIIDPKGTNYQKYTGATVVKPNLKEFNQATGMEASPDHPNFFDQIREGACNLFNKFSIENLLVTLSEYGMVFISSKNPDELFHIPTEAREVFDVSGAGDTSLATFGASIAAGSNIQDAMKLANIASGIAVGKVGTSCVSSQELLNELSRRRTTGTCLGWKQKSKIISVDEAANIAVQLHIQKRIVGFTNGCFDLLHMGHLHSLIQAKGECDVLMVGLNSDTSIKRLKGNDRPIQDEKTRALLVASLEFVDYVIMFDDDTALQIVDAVHPDIILKEGYTMDNWPEAKLVESYGGKSVILHRLKNYSTTNIISKIKFHNIKY